MVRSFRFLRTRAGTPAHPGRTWFGHSAFAACGRGRPRSQVARGSVIPLSPHAGADARAPRSHVVRSFRLRRVRARTPAHPGRTWFGHSAFAARGRGRPRTQVARGSVIPPSPHAGGDARAPRTRVVRSFRFRRTRAGTPALPGRAWFGHSAFAACGRGRPRSQVAHGSVIPPSPHAGGDARAPRTCVVRSFRIRRMRAGTPALPGRAWCAHSAFAARGRGRPRSQVARGSVISPSPHAGEDARAPRSRVVRSFRFLRMRAGTPALPGCTWFGHSAFAACGRGRPRSQVARGSVIPPSLHTGGDARAPRTRVVRSFRFRRMRARTPALPGRTWCGHSAFAACGRGRPRSQVARGSVIPPSLHTGGDARAPRTCVVRSFRLRRMRARTPAHPGRAWCAHSAFAACGRGRPRSQDVRGALILPSLRAGADARAPRLHVVRSFRLRRMRAGTPALPGRTWFGHSAFAAHGRGRPRTQDVRGALIPPSPHAGEDARTPRTHVVQSFRIRRTRARTPALPGCTWFGHSAFAAHGRGRPRSQVARGSVIPPSLHTGGDARAPRLHLVRSFRLRRTRAGTPALPGCTWFGHFAFSACGRGRPRSQVARGSVISLSPQAGGDARAPRSHVVRSFRLRRMRARTPALPASGSTFARTVIGLPDSS
jgi:hypothetical protein